MGHKAGLCLVLLFLQLTTSASGMDIIDIGQGDGPQAEASSPPTDGSTPGDVAPASTTKLGRATTETTTVTFRPTERRTTPAATAATTTAAPSTTVTPAPTERRTTPAATAATTTAAPSTTVTPAPTANGQSTGQGRATTKKAGDGTSNWCSRDSERRTRSLTRVFQVMREEGFFDDCRHPHHTGTGPNTSPFSWFQNFRPGFRTGVATGGEMKFYSSGDNEHWVYADGKQIGHLNDWTQTLTVTVPANTRVIAVKITDVGTVGGLLGSFSDGSVTDETWKCTRTVPRNACWVKPDFDDSAWPAALATEVHGAEPWGWRPLIAHNAKWLWNLQYPTIGESSTVYCRKRLASPTAAVRTGSTITTTTTSNGNSFVRSGGDWLEGLMDMAATHYEQDIEAFRNRMDRVSSGVGKVQSGLDTVNNFLDSQRNASPRDGIRDAFIGINRHRATGGASTTAASTNAATTARNPSTDSTSSTFAPTTARTTVGTGSTSGTSAPTTARTIVGTGVRAPHMLAGGPRAKRQAPSQDDETSDDLRRESHGEANEEHGRRGPGGKHRGGHGGKGQGGPGGKGQGGPGGKGHKKPHHHSDEEEENMSQGPGGKKHGGPGGKGHKKPHHHSDEEDGSMSRGPGGKGHKKPHHHSDEEDGSMSRGPGGKGHKKPHHHSDEEDGSMSRGPGGKKQGGPGGKGHRGPGGKGHKRPPPSHSHSNEEDNEEEQRSPAAGHTSNGGTGQGRGGLLGREGRGIWKERPTTPVSAAADQTSPATEASTTPAATVALN